MIKMTYDDKELKIFLTKLDRNIKQATEPLAKSARYMENQARVNFSAKGRTMGEGWKDWAASTRKVREGTMSFRTIKGRVVPVSPQPGDAGGKLMEQTGLLKNSFLTMGPRMSKTKGEVEVYNPTYYAKYHQFGGGRLPRRVLLKFTKAHVAEIGKIFEQWLGRAINKSVKA